MTWPSPSPETEVRNRVQARARSIIRRRLTSAATVAALALAAVVLPGLDGDTAAQRLRVADQPDAVADDASTETPAPIGESGVPAGAPQTGTGNRAASHRDGPASVPRPQDLPPPIGNDSPPSYMTTHPLMTDPVDDVIPERCPSIDFTSGDVRLEGGDVVVAMTVADLGSGPRSAGEGPVVRETETWLAKLQYEDAWFELRVVRTVQDGSVASSGTFVAPAGAVNQAYYVDGVEADLGADGQTVTVRVALEAMNAAMGHHPHHDYAPLATGTTVVPTFDSAVGRGTTMNSQWASWDAMAGAADNAHYRLGD